MTSPTPAHAFDRVPSSYDTVHLHWLRLHVARALLVLDCDGLPFGCVDWSHPLAVQVQLLELEWASLTEAQRLEGEAALRQWHGWCGLYNCRVTIRLGVAGSGPRRPR